MQLSDLTPYIGRPISEVRSRTYPHVKVNEVALNKTDLSSLNQVTAVTQNGKVVGVFLGTPSLGNRK